MALLVLKEMNLHFGPKVIFDRLGLSIEKGERIALLGRNGVGKTTLFKLLENRLKPDSGEFQKLSNLKICSLDQEVPEDTQGSIFEVVYAGLEKSLKDSGHWDEYEDEFWKLEQKVNKVLSKLDLPPEDLFENLSGGLRRRVMLAQALVQEPDLLLLDEPTNHLDIQAVEWLENYLPNYPGSILFITHDRRFLQKIAKRIIELDRGRLQSFEGSYSQFLVHKEAELSAEEHRNSEFDKRLAEEEVWIRQGVKARRTRNEGRVRALEKMRQEFSERRNQIGKAEMVSVNAGKSGKKVLEAKNISYQTPETNTMPSQKLFKNFSTIIQRGDRIGILGPNGCGKSTFLNVLLGELKPTEGSVELGTELNIAYFDQLRDQLDPNKTLLENISGGSEFIDINGKQTHILSYLRRYLFEPARAREKVGVLSGGERNRALLAKILSKPSNLLILDEPTNDLDLETLELLEELLIDYSGTLLLVSHDREFLDNVITSTLVFEEDESSPGDILINQYVGGYQDWLRQRKNLEKSLEKNSAGLINLEQEKKNNKNKKSQNLAIQKLSIPERQRLEKLPAEIELKEIEIAELEEKLAGAEFYQKDPEGFMTSGKNLEKSKTELAGLYQLWEEFDARK